MKDILMDIRHAQWRWDYATAGHGASFHAPVEIGRTVSSGLAIAIEARVKLARVLAALGQKTPVSMPDISTKAKAQEYVGLNMKKLHADKEKWKKEVLPTWDAKAKEGVKVRVLYDDVGCNGVKKEFFQQMRDAGAEVHALLHVRFPMLTDRVNYRNHRKIVVIDGRVGFFGGMNIADRYVKGPGWGVWRDSHFKVEGKGVYGLQSAFLVDWSTVERVHLDTSKFFPEADNYTSSTMQFATSGPLGPWRTLLQGIMTAIAGARRSICIQTPYFLPTEGLNSLLQTAALGGIDVQLMLPERSDSRIIDKAVHSFIDDMLRAGVKVYFYTKGFLHAKMLIVDDLLTVVGSANMDFRSFEHNFEINAFVYGQDFNTAMRRVFDEDLRSCRRLIPSEWLRRPLPQRLSESFMRLFSPLL
jgi:cardiolipin synthase